jgi:hypothetical protein
MQFARKSLLAILGVLLPLFLLATAFDFGVLRVAGGPTPVKKILSDSGIYSSVVASALDQAQKSAQNGDEVSLSDPAIKKAAGDAFNPQVVQSSTEKVIDGVYNWLDGKTAQPDFNVDLTNVKTSFAEKVGQAAADRAATLPVCTTPPASTDPFSATCRPPNLTPVQIGTQAKNDVLNAQGFLEHPNITADSVIKSDSGQSVFDSNLKDAPKQYQRVKKTPIILSILTVLTIVAIIFLSSSRRKGLRRVGIVLAVVGAFMLLFAFSLNRVAVHNVIPKINLDNAVLQTNVRILATEVVQSIDQNYWIFGTAYFALGVLAILVTMLIGRGGVKESVAAKEGAASVSSAPPKPQAPKPKTAKPKSAPRIQG